MDMYGSESESESERRVKSHAGVYLGTSAGSRGSRATLADGMGRLHDLIAEMVGGSDQYGSIEMRVDVRAGRVVLVETAAKTTSRNLEKNLE